MKLLGCDIYLKMRPNTLRVRFYPIRWKLTALSRPSWIYIGVSKKFGTVIFYALTLPNINDFQNYITTRIRRKLVIILSLKIPSHLRCVATLPCEMSSVLEATNENKTTSITTYFKKLTTANNVFIVSVIV